MAGSSPGTGDRCRGDRSIDGLSAQEVQRATFQAMARLVTQLACEAPLVIEVDSTSTGLTQRRRIC